MVDFSVFDSILDAAFIVDGDGKILYCNDAGATFCQTSVRRVVGKAKLSDLLTVNEGGMLPFTTESQGRTAPTPFLETEFTIAKDGRTGKLQLSVRPVAEGHWLFYIRDVSLEEALHSKYRSELSQKEDYARNLEKLVEARTAELDSVNQTMKAILNSLGQGFFTFNLEGDCGNVFTKACEEILEGIPVQRKAWEVLAVPSSEHEQFRKWTDSMFKELLPFDDMKGLGPNLYPHSQKRRVELEYYPIRKESAISEVVVVATDKTTEFEFQQQLESERQFAAMIVKYMKNKDQFLQFLVSVRNSMNGLTFLASQPMALEDVNESFRILHTLEGEAGTFSLRDLRLLSRVSQQILEEEKGAPALSKETQERYFASLQNISVEFNKFLETHSDIFRIPEGRVSRSVEMPLDELTEIVEEMRRSPATRALAEKFQDKFLQVSLESCLKYYDNLIQGVAEKLDKRVKPLKIAGGEIRIFPEPYQKLLSSLVHAFRNAVDHGLESPLDREWAGKDPAGQIQVSVSIQGDMFTMVISDDGKGIDPAIIREKMKQKFPEQDFTSQSDEEIIQSVSLPGFSSRDTIGEFSGRGVGLDALREEVLRLGGRIHIQSVVGQGTSITLTFPRLGYEPAPLLRSA